MSRQVITRERTVEHNARIGEAVRKRRATPTKTCPGCKRDLDRATMFRMRTNGRTSRSLCIDCEGPANREANRRAQFKRKYGITVDEYEAMKESQGGKCLLCDRHEDGMRRALVVDHNHTTGALRGLLCDKCNMALGLLGDDIATVRRLLAYLTTHA